MVNEATDNPLTLDDLAAINRVLELSAKHKALLQRCQNCGLPVEDHIARNQQHAEMAAALKREFFPHEA